MKLIKSLFYVLIACAALYSCKSDDSDVNVASVKITTQAFTLTEAGAFKTLEWTINPNDATNKNVGWTSRNTSIATVDQVGKVTAVANGSTYIVVNTVDGNKRDSVQVTVNIPSVISSLNLTEPSGPIVVGETHTLSCTSVPHEVTNDKLTWVSRNTAVATVSNYGVVTAVGVGNTYIVATEATSGLKDSVQIFVVAATIPATGITINQSDFSIDKGDTKPLTTTITPSNATATTVVWTSSNTAIATVNSDGLVTAVNVGTATITATIDGTTIKDNVEVTVTEPVIPVTGVVINEGSFSVEEGGTKQLTATITPANATNTNLIWASSNTGVATVSNTGLVTAIGAGTATITATADGTSIKGSVVATVTASGPGVAVTGITVTPTEYGMFINDNTQLTCTVEPSNAANKNVTWTSSNNGIAVVSPIGDGSTCVVTSIGTPGDVIITATTVDGSFQASTNIKVGAKDITGVYTGELNGASGEISVMGITIPAFPIVQNGDITITQDASNTKATIAINQTVAMFPLELATIECPIEFTTKCTIKPGTRSIELTVESGNPYGLPPGTYGVTVNVVEGSIDAAGNVTVKIKASATFLSFFKFDVFEGTFIGVKQ